MRTIPTFTLSLALLAGVPVGSATAQRTPTQRDVSRMLMSTDPATQTEALRMARMLRPEHTSPDLRYGLFVALDRLSAAYHTHVGAMGPNSPDPFGDDTEAAELHAGLLAVIVGLGDSTIIPVLARNLGTGLVPVRALVGFGRTAVRAVLNVANHGETPVHRVDAALLTLRMLVEQPSVQAWDAGRRADVRQTARQFLMAPRAASTLAWAIDLAIVLGDPDLRQLVQAIAADPEEVRRRGIHDPTLVAQMQQYARDRLAGIPPLPRY